MVPCPHAGRLSICTGQAHDGRRVVLADGRARRGNQQPPTRCRGREAAGTAGSGGRGRLAAAGRPSSLLNSSLERNSTCLDLSMRLRCDPSNKAMNVMAPQSSPSPLDNFAAVTELSLRKKNLSCSSAERMAGRCSPLSPVSSVANSSSHSRPRASSRPRDNWKNMVRNQRTPSADPSGPYSHPGPSLGLRFPEAEATQSCSASQDRGAQTSQEAEQEMQDFAAVGSERRGDGDSGAWDESRNPRRSQGGKDPFRTRESSQGSPPSASPEPTEGSPRAYLGVESGARRGVVALPQADPSSPLIVLPGGGMFFYWQLGALTALSRSCDLSNAHFQGASAGALAGVLAACQVQGRGAAEAAFSLSLQNKIWDNPTGLAGVWGPLVRQWLDELLPQDAADLCSSRLFLQVLELPSISRRSLSFQHSTVSSFSGREDLLDCCMASVHIPFFMDGRAWTTFRGRKCVDGSIMAPPYPTDSQRPVLVLDYTFDEEMKQRRWEFLSLGAKEGGYAATWDWIQIMMVRGAAYVDNLSKDGSLHFLQKPVADLGLRQ